MSVRPSCSSSCKGATVAIPDRAARARGMGRGLRSDAANWLDVAGSEHVSRSERQREQGIFRSALDSRPHGPAALGAVGSLRPTRSRTSCADLRQPQTRPLAPDAKARAGAWTRREIALCSSRLSHGPYGPSTCTRSRCVHRARELTHEAATRVVAAHPRFSAAAPRPGTATWCGRRRGRQTSPVPAAPTRRPPGRTRPGRRDRCGAARS